jgi:predicted nucleic acid-binding protein
MIPDPDTILDADVMIDLLRGNATARAWLASLPAPPAAAGFAAMEITTACLNRVELRSVQKFLRSFTLLWPTETDLQRALNEYLPLRLAHGIGMVDTVIAATATGAGLTLVTLNVRHFRHIPGLTVLRPYVK